MNYGYFSKYDPEVVRVYQIYEHHAKIVKLGRYASVKPVYVLPVTLLCMVGFENNLARMIIMIRQCVANNIARLKVKVTFCS